VKIIPKRINIDDVENNFSVKTSFMANLIGIKENVPITFEKYKSTIIFPPFMHNREK